MTAPATFLDAQTLRDLEIFQGQGGAQSLFDLLDRTRTRRGREALRARFLKPLTTVAEIRAVQDALEFITRRRSLFANLPQEQVLSEFGSYLRSNVMLLQRRRGLKLALEVFWVPLRYPDLYERAYAGVTLTADIVGGLVELTSHPGLSGAPGALEPRLAEMRLLLAYPELAQLTDRAGIMGSEGRVLRVDREIREDRQREVERLLELLSELDALVSMADATQAGGYSFPEVCEGPAGIAAEGIFHPFLASPVPNALRLVEHRLLFITGPNMAGKTTYLRACGIAAYLAHLGMGVPARSFRFSPFDCLLTAISLSDNTREGISFFRAEALRIRQIACAAAARQRVLALLDEPFKGTNVKDALDASGAVLTCLARVRSSAFLVASHLIELAEPLAALPGVGCYMFEAQETHEGLRFDYALKPGHSAQRLGMRVLEEEGVFRVLSEMSDGELQPGSTRHE